MVGAKNFSPRRRTEGSPLGADGPCRRTINARRVRAAHHTGPGEGPGDTVPVFAVRFGVVKGGASVAGIGPGPTGGARSTRVLWVRQPLSFLPENRKKIRNFTLFFCDPGLLSDYSAGRSMVAAEWPGAGPSPQPSERTGNILKSGQPGPAGFPVFGKTEKRNQDRWRARAGTGVVGAGLGGGVLTVEHAEKKSFLRNERERLQVAICPEFLA